MARFHVLGMVLKNKKPEIFEKAKKQTEIKACNINQFFDALHKVLKDIQEISNFSKHMDVINTSFSNMTNEETFFCTLKEPWITIIHGDFWINNILFHKDKHGNVDDVKFIDFQTYRYNSPLKDLLRFLCGNLDEETSDKYFDALIDHYYNEFITKLNLMQCRTSEFSKGSFDQELKRVAVHDFAWFTLAVKLVAFEVEKNSKTSDELMNYMFESNQSEALEKRLLKLLAIYERKGWFN